MRLRFENLDFEDVADKNFDGGRERQSEKVTNTRQIRKNRKEVNMKNYVAIPNSGVFSM